jgi:hypothetical protein
VLSLRSAFPDLDFALPTADVMMLFIPEALTLFPFVVLEFVVVFLELTVSFFFIFHSSNLLLVKK